MDILITDKENGITVKELLSRRLKYSSTLIKTLKSSEDGIMLNGKRVTVRAVLNTGDTLSLTDRELCEESEIIPKKNASVLLYEDESVIAFLKPSGIPTHPSRSHIDDTLANHAAYVFKCRNEKFVFRPVSRLDSDVSGVVLCAKDKLSSQRLCTDIANASIEKTYLAVCDGAPYPAGTSGTVEGFISREDGSIIARKLEKAGEGAYAKTDYKILAENGKNSLIEVHPITGRTHQIRLSLASIGAAISGDGFYGNEYSAPRCMLHALSVSFTHPKTQERMTVKAPLCEDMHALIEEKFGENIYGS
jgi:23S rRNA pseudouridine1911/1915/1917 synthase